MRTTLLIICIQCISIINADSDEIQVSPAEFDEVADGLNFKGKVVLITGSSSGIGATTAHLYARLGAQVVVTGRNQNRVDRVVRECRRLSPNRLRPLGISLDLLERGNIANLVNKTIMEFNKIDILVNNAGVGNSAVITDPKFNQIYRDMKAINEEVPVELTRLCAPYLIRSRGSIVFISSGAARKGIGGFAAYSMSKSSIIAFAQALAHDLSPNVRVNVVSPGVTDGTRIFLKFTPELRPLLIEHSINTSSLRRASVPLDIAKLIVFLSTNLANSLNGQNLYGD